VENQQVDHQRTSDNDQQHRPTPRRDYDINKIFFFSACGEQHIQHV
jgi:hypothetical protein